MDPPPHTRVDAEADAEAATQQLLAESRASTSKLRHSPPPSAVLGASLLNAARIHDRHSSPVGMTRKAGAGKLKRPSMVAEEQSRKNLATRGDVYDIMVSPEKGAFRLPETVNQQPLKVVRKKRTLQQEESEAPSEGQQLASELPPTQEEAGSRPNHTRTRKKRKPEHAPDEIGRPSKSPRSRAQESNGLNGTRHAPLQPKKGKGENSHAPSRRTQPRIQIPVRAGSRQKVMEGDVAEDRSRHVQQGDVQDTIGRTRSKRQATDLDPDEDEDSEQPDRPGACTEEVFQFLDTEERPGKCQTKFGTTIKRASQRFRKLVQSEDLSIDAVIEDFSDIRSVLKRVHVEVSEDDRLAFKSDAYGYIFRALTAYLEALYSWLGEKCESVNESLEALHILSPLTHEILALKDTIAEWDVSVPQRYKGDRIIMDVDSSLIVPLRRLDKSFRIQLYQLEAAEQRRQQRAELERRREEEADEERKIAEATKASRERWRRWQILHISRMQCEPDPKRRRKLAITKLGDIEEKDANGVKFERVPLFKARSTPPLHWASSMSEERVWTDDEETALLEGLQSFAGKFTHAFTWFQSQSF